VRTPARFTRSRLSPRGNPHSESGLRHVTGQGCCPREGGSLRGSRHKHPRAPIETFDAVEVVPGESSTGVISPALQPVPLQLGAEGDGVPNTVREPRSSARMQLLCRELPHLPLARHGRLPRVPGILGSSAGLRRCNSSRSGDRDGHLALSEALGRVIELISETRSPPPDVSSFGGGLNVLVAASDSGGGDVGTTASVESTSTMSDAAPRLRRPFQRNGH
jgi:hypothetical protein